MYLLLTGFPQSKHHQLLNVHATTFLREWKENRAHTNDTIVFPLKCLMYFVITGVNISCPTVTIIEVWILTDIFFSRFQVVLCTLALMRHVMILFLSHLNDCSHVHAQY